MSGYDKSPDYGGKPSTWLGTIIAGTIIAGAVIVAMAAGLAWLSTL